MTGRRIVIGHEKARWLGKLDASAPPSRSREEALQLALDIYEMAKASPSRFPQLVAQHSDLRDRVVEGDFGTYPNREPCPFPLGRTPFRMCAPRRRRARSQHALSTRR